VESDNGTVLIQYIIPLNS